MKHLFLVYLLLRIIHFTAANKRKTTPTAVQPMKTVVKTRFWCPILCDFGISIPAENLDTLLGIAYRNWAKHASEFGINCKTLRLEQ